MMSSVWVDGILLSATRYMKVKRMGITEILRKIWLFSANKIKSSESVTKQPTQLIIVAEIRHITVYSYSLFTRLKLIFLSHSK